EYDKNSIYHILGYGIDIANVLSLDTLGELIVSCEEAIKDFFVSTGISKERK
ncbi:MAG: hypothetical protein H6R42_265, partial [Nitrospirae bacterium]|nr:hypothetical protein [Nitrospirota bacterium]